MVLTQVSPTLKAQFASAEKKDGLILKKLATEEEVGALKGPFKNYVDRILRIFVRPRGWDKEHLIRHPSKTPL